MASRDARWFLYDDRDDSGSNFPVSVICIEIHVNNIAIFMSVKEYGPRLLIKTSIGREREFFAHQACLSWKSGKNIAFSKDPRTNAK